MDISHEELTSLSKRFGSSFYIFNPEQFALNFQEFRTNFRELYPKTEVAFAYKANYMPALGDIISDQNGIIEVASRLEYDIALKSINPERIIFNGPMKSKDDLYHALSQNSIVNIDSFYEIQYIKELLKENRIEEAQIGIRVNFKVLELISRFGFDVANGELDKALKEISEDKRIKVVGIHSHFTTKKRCLETFAIRVKNMSDIFKRLKKNHPIKFIDIGGGFFGGMTPELIEKYQVYVPTIKEYAKTITSTLKNEIKDENDMPTLIIEPGISMAANIMHLFAQIVEIKRVDEKYFAVCDTSINVVNPEKSSVTSPYKIIKKTQMPDIGKNEYTVVGNTCLEYDVIIRDCNVACERGDFIMFKNRGAYSNVRTPVFIMPTPPIIGRNGEVYKKRDTCETVLSTYFYKSKNRPD